MTERNAATASPVVQKDRAAWEKPRVSYLDVEAAEGAIGVGVDIGIYS